MGDPQNVYWPFDVLPVEQQSEHHRRLIRFLETGFREGYKPYKFGVENIGASAGERSGEIIYRGKDRWEVVLGIPGNTVLSAHLDDFNFATEAVIRWLRGSGAADILEHIRGHLVRSRGLGGFRLNEPSA